MNYKDMNTLISKVKRKLPSSLKRRLQKYYYIFTDVIEFAGRKKRTSVPPKRLNFVGAGDFESIGKEFFSLFKKLGNLQPNHKVLDVGCGVGRMAIPLTNYLESGAYHGFDIVPSGIRWCEENIASKYSNFFFSHANIYNKRYNPKGTLKAAEYKFPYDENTFDFVFLTSVFTHMLPEDVENFMKEIARVLKPGGTSFITYYLLNKESIESIQSGNSLQSFKFDFGLFRAGDKRTPEEAIGFKEDFISNLYKGNNLDVRRPIYLGAWTGRKNATSFQDIIIATKKLS